jgi:hypothetical protein
MDSCERLARFYKTEYGKRARARFIAAMEASDPDPDSGASDVRFMRCISDRLSSNH